MGWREGKRTFQGWTRTHTPDALEVSLLQPRCCSETCRKGGISNLKATGALGPGLGKVQGGMWGDSGELAELHMQEVPSSMQ